MTTLFEAVRTQGELLNEAKAQLKKAREANGRRLLFGELYLERAEMEREIGEEERRLDRFEEAAERMLKKLSYERLQILISFTEVELGYYW